MSFLNIGPSYDQSQDLFKETFFELHIILNNLKMWNLELANPTLLLWYF